MAVYYLIKILFHLFRKFSVRLIKILDAVSNNSQGYFNYTTGTFRIIDGTAWIHSKFNLSSIEVGIGSDMTINIAL